jgi:hypothetical protein
MKKYLVLLGILLVFSISCGDEGGLGKICDPGVTQQCACATQQIGIQSCNVTGTGWTACTGCNGQADADINKSDGGVGQCSENCSAKDYGDVRFTCSLCSGVPTCLPRLEMFTGEVSKYLGYKYTHRTPDCKSNSTLYLKSSYFKQANVFEHEIMTQHFGLTVDVRDVTENFTDTFFSVTSSSKNNLKVTVVLFDKTTNTSCYNHNDSTIPPNFGTFNISFSKLSLGGSYTLSMDGLVKCNAKWKWIKYEAKGFIVGGK